MPRDYHQEKNLFEKAAEKKNADAQHKLGEMYNGGLGVRQNKATAKSGSAKRAITAIKPAVSSIERC